MGERTPFTLPAGGGVGVLVNPSGECGPQLLEIDAWAGEHGLRVHDLGVVGRDEEDLAERSGASDLVIALGGDGTILQALHLAGPHGAAVLGVNFGHRGFLADTVRERLPAALEAVAEGRAVLEARMALSVHGDGVPAAVAYNEVVLGRAPGRGSARVHVDIAGRRLLDVAGDGIVAATPTGSTAYTLSAGGPVVSPHLDALVLTPLAAQTTPLRSLVVAAGEPVRLRVSDEGAPLVLEVDGRVAGEVAPGAHVDVRRADLPGLLVRTGPESFYDDLRSRLLSV